MSLHRHVTQLICFHLEAKLIFDGAKLGVTPKIAVKASELLPKAEHVGDLDREIEVAAESSGAETDLSVDPAAGVRRRQDFDLNALSLWIANGPTWHGGARS